MADKLPNKRLDRAPFNISLLNLNDDNMYKMLGQVTSGNMFDGANFHLHKEGLWSPVLFGEVGSPERMKKQGWINLNVPIIHPAVYRELISASSLIDEIIDGKTFAQFDTATKMFVRSNILEGETGYDFFYRHLADLQMPDTGSPKRRDLIKLLEKNQERMRIDKLIVLQAGYRDVEFKDGQIDHDEINQIYREILSLSNSLELADKKNLSAIDTTRCALQKAVLKLYMYLGEITGHGKKKLIQGKWASRNVFAGTANVITAPDVSGRFIDDERNIGYKDTIVGMYQHIVACLPFAVRGIKNSFLSEMFHNPLEPVRLVNKKTLKSDEIILGTSWFDLFQSEEGIKNLLQRFRANAIRHKAVEVEGRYLALIYLGDDMTFKVLHSIDELPSHLNRDNVRPMTFMDLVYICTYHEIEGTNGIATRYPITGISSNVPSFAKVQSTKPSERRWMLDENWEKIEDKVYHTFPIKDAEIFNSMSPPVAAYGGLSADNDGDRTNWITSLTEESQEEQKEYRKQKRAYVDPDGNIRYPLSYDTVNFVCYNLSHVKET